MFRLLALPVAVALAAVLASSGCAAVGEDRIAPVMQSGEATPSATAPAGSEQGGGSPGGAEPSASDDQGAVEPSASEADAPAAEEGDPGVPGLPQQSGASIDDVLRLGAVASWAEQPRLIALSLPASSDCWAFAAEAVVQSPTRIVVRVEQPQLCGAVDAARTYSIAVPDGVDASADLQLAIVGLEHELTLTLPAAA